LRARDALLEKLAEQKVGPGSYDYPGSFADGAACAFGATRRAITNWRRTKVAKATRSLLPGDADG
jgi:hypothetical protein